MISKTALGEYPLRYKIFLLLIIRFMSVFGGGRKISVCSPDGAKLKDINVGDHPNAMIFSPDGSSLVCGMLKY